MQRLENYIRPQPRGSLLARDVLSTGLLLALAVALLPAMGLSWKLLGSALSVDASAAGEAAAKLSRQARGSMSWCLLPAIAFGLALRQGAIDVSVWAIAGLGGLAGAAALTAGWGPTAALLAALAAGAGVGALNGFLVGYVRVPSLLVTLVVGMGLLWAAGAWADHPRRVPLPDDAFAQWHVPRPPPLPAGGANGTQPAGRQEQRDDAWPLWVTRMLVVGILFGLTALVLMTMMAHAIGRPEPGHAKALLASLTASGALAAAGGMCWLLDQPTSAPVPTRLIDDLRIPAAAILAGAAFLGRRRTAFMVLCMPAALVVVTAWRQDVWFLSVHGYALQVAVLAGMTAVTQLAFAQAADPPVPGRRLARAAAALTATGLVAAAASVAVSDLAARDLWRTGALSVWIAGALTLLPARLLRHRHQPRPAEATPPAG